MNAMTLPRQQIFWMFLVGAMILFSALNRQPAHHFNIKEVSALEAQEMVTSGAVVIDVRDFDLTGHARLPGALHFPEAVLQAGLAKLDVAKTARILVYCGDGSTHGPEATEALNRAGYANAVNLKEGFEGWKAAGLPTVRG